MLAVSGRRDDPGEVMVSGGRGGVGGVVADVENMSHQEPELADLATVGQREDKSQSPFGCW